MATNTFQTYTGLIFFIFILNVIIYCQQLNISSKLTDTFNL